MPPDAFGEERRREELAFSPVPEPWTTSASATLGGTDGVVTLV